MNTGMNMNDMVAALVKQPEDKRRMMMDDRLQMFIEMPNDKRQNAMKMMISATYALPDNDMRKLIATRTGLLAEMPEANRKKLMMTHMQLIKSFPEAKRMKEMKIVEESIATLPQTQRQTMMKMMKGMQSDNMPMGGGQMGMSGGAATLTAPRPTTAAADSDTPRWVTLALGIWAIVAAFIFDAGASGGIIAQVIGGVVAGFFPLINSGYWIAALAGVWLIIAPFIFGYGGIALVSSILTGIAITALSAYKATR
jgi:SPW repeat